MLSTEEAEQQDTINCVHRIGKNVENGVEYENKMWDFVGVMDDFELLLCV